MNKWQRQTAAIHMKDWFRRRFRGGGIKPRTSNQSFFPSRSKNSLDKKRHVPLTKRLAYIALFPLNAVGQLTHNIMNKKITITPKKLLIGAALVSLATVYVVKDQIIDGIKLEGAVGVKNKFFNNEKKPNSGPLKDILESPGR